MGIRFRATGIAIGVLLVVALVRPAKADTYHATGQTDVACAQIGPPVTCSDISYSLDFTTGPLFGPDKAIKKFYIGISEISGEINGVPISCVPETAGAYPCGHFLASQLNYPGPPIPDGGITLVGSSGIFGFLSAGPDTTVPFPSPDVRVGFGDSRAYTTWNIVNTPEPSTLLSLGIGLLGLMGLTLLKSRSS